MAREGRQNGLVRPPFFLFSVFEESVLTRPCRLGNLTFIPSITLLILGLVWGGQTYAWSSAHVLAPLIIGVLGLVLWFVLEKYYVAHPTVPFALLINRTTAVGYAGTWIHGVVALVVFYYWPVYFQAVKGVSPVKWVILSLSILNRVVTDVQICCRLLLGGVHRGAVCDGSGWVDIRNTDIQAAKYHRLGCVSKPSSSH